MKVAYLSGAELDYWAAKANGLHPIWWADHWFTGLDREEQYSPSTNWHQAGPIIERELYAVERFRGDDMAWIASYGDPECPRSETGPTPLVAAMRAYVASKFGDEVPEEK